MNYSKGPEAYRYVLAKEAGEMTTVSQKWQGFDHDATWLLGQEISGVWMPNIELPDGLSADLIVPHWAFRPDWWSLSLLRGISKGLESGQIKKEGHWCEVGVGTGINPIYLTQRLGIDLQNMTITDFDQKAVPLAIHNIANNCPKLLPKLKTWSSDLLRSVADDSKYNVMFACIPQVPKKDLEETYNRDGREDDLSNYFDPKRYIIEDNLDRSQALSSRGLLLVDAFLRENKGKLVDENSHILLNIGGRPSWAAIAEMIESNGFNWEILHQDMIQQHPETDIKPCAMIENASIADFEFFKKLPGNNGFTKINARTAHEMMLAGGEVRDQVHHEIFVVSCKPR